VRGAPASYAVVTAAFTLLVAGVVVAWRDADGSSPSDRPRAPGAAALASIAALLLIVTAMARWARLMAWQPYQADMLIVIREATRRFLSGRMPYATYRSYDTTWDMVMPYGPALWGPFVAAQLLRLDFRIVTIAGELFVPTWCGVAAAVDASRGRAAAALSWLGLLAAFLLAIDVQRFTLIAHTPVYWPLFLPFAVAVRKRRWIAAAFVLGLLVVARQTMVSMIPVFVAAVWMSDRRDTRGAVAVLVLTVAVALAPFLVWDARALWDSMILSYPRVMKTAVWPVLARPGLETIGITEWLLERHREWLIVPVQLTALGAVYAGAWTALRRGRNPLPWMALSLFAFSMTTLYPVHYLYYDVLLLLACARIADMLGASPALTATKTWALSAIAVTAVIVAAVRAVAPAFPAVAAGERSGERPFRSGFAASESDGSRTFAWIVGHDARIVLPRGSAAAADIVLVAQSPFRDDQPPQRMSAVLNGTLLAETIVPAGWQEIRIAAPRAAWWIGFNELQLRFASTVAPRDVGGGEDPRPLALGLSRLDVVTRRR